MPTSWRPRAGLFLLTLAAAAAAVEYQVTQKDFQKCSGMYSRKAWGGAVDPFILTKFPPPADIPDGEDPVVSVVMFEWRDRPFIATGPEGNAMICDHGAVEAGSCTEEQLGEFILAPNATDKSRYDILTQAVHLSNPPAIRYPVKKTGYYCLVTNPFSANPDTEEYTAMVEFRNAFGELPAAQIAKLPFYAAFTIIYAFVAIGWAALYYLNRSDILAVQNYVTAILVFLVIEMFMTWLFYDYQNRHGLSVGAKALMIVVSILSAARNSFSFFLLLIVCMGYGVVKPTLGKTMIYVRWLAITHFVFGVIYAIASLSITPENAGPLILLVVLPLAASLTAFYVWTLNSLNLTMKDLTQRKQTVKAAMYRKLWWCILLTIIVIFVFFFINSWTFAGTTTTDFIPTHWQTRWFILDGWLNLVYLADVAFIAYIWRPTANNRRFAMSDELAQDDDGFEIASLRDSFDLDLEDPETDGGGKYDREGSPLPAPKPMKVVEARRLGRESLEGEQGVFALGEEEEEEEEKEEEGEGLFGGRRR
ncbi:ER membrane protein [Teratosphaeria nubilosa]|uniref:ER membrane protein n=1 Tax=Teratosphaeria nubilosa TaxID=161662 RepID=A0A6G1L600_9PEZI|nr:ER membrane protein [Teratosphaeria nubilosa]